MRNQMQVTFAALALLLAKLTAADTPDAGAADAPDAGADEAPAPSSELLVPLTKSGPGSFLVEGTDFLDTDKVREHLDSMRQAHSRSNGDDDSNVDGNANDKRGTVQVPLVNPGGGSQLWTGPIKVGTPPKTLTVAFNTGAADFVVNPATYNPAASKSAKDTGSKFNNAYGATRSAAGSIYYDTAVIGGVPTKKVVIGRSSSDFIGDGANALGGLALPELSYFPQPLPLWKALSDQGTIKPIFSMKIAQSGSALTLGAAGPNPTYLPISSKNKNEGFWMVPGTIGGVSQDVIIDSTTDFIIAPPAMAQKIFQSLKVRTWKDSSGVAYGLYKCGSPPKVAFQFGSKKLNLPASAANIGASDDGSCTLPILGWDVGFAATVGGGSLFKSTPAITFDYTNRRVGFS